jgi:very-short-patch-repair endonuclease
MRTQLPNASLIGALADVQNGVVARAQLLELGLSRGAIGRAVRSGLLRPIFRGVYAVGHTALRREGWWQAALLACGEGSVLSHHSAGALWGLRSAPMFPIHVINDGDRGRQQARIATHRMLLARSETNLSDGIRTTTPARTIVDLSPHLPGRARRELIERAQDRRRFHPTKIAASLALVPNRRGARELRALLDLLQPDKDNARSHLERLFLKLVRSGRVPGPEVNYVIAGRRRDFVWIEQRLVVETDGYRWHSTRQAQQRDRRRDRELTSLGWRPVRFTYEEVAFEPDRVARELRSLLHLT